MSTTCGYCGYKSNEVKGGGPISEMARKITLKCTNIEDLSRDVLKSETCALSVPELELELASGTLGGKFTTIEGLLTQVYNELKAKLTSIAGDSQPEQQNKSKAFLDKLDDAIKLKKNFTFVLDDALANSYVQNLYAPDPDPNMEILDYERTFDQNEDLGLNDIKTENY